MLEHLNVAPQAPERVVIMGAGGFVGNATRQRLEKDSINVLALTRQEVDLLADGAAGNLAARLAPGDTLVVTSALAPCKNEAMYNDNLAMMVAVTDALRQVEVSHVIYISSDAVYSDSDSPITEDSPTEPDSFHGRMHAAREEMLKKACRAPLAILRPSLLYGASDPHNGYGPNRFRRLADEAQDIVLFGEGEEQRDHVLIDDVAEIIRLVILHKSQGVLNVATGDVISFRKIAKQVASLFDTTVHIKGSPRQGSMPHGGYRPFDIAACKKAFPEFSYTPLAEGLALVQAQISEQADG